MIPRELVARLVTEVCRVVLVDTAKMPGAVRLSWPWSPQLVGRVDTIDWTAADGADWRRLVYWSPMEGDPGDPSTMAVFVSGPVLVAGLGVIVRRERYPWPDWWEDQVAYVARLGGPAVLA